MAPSSNYTLIALLVAFVAVLIVAPSQAARDGGAAKAPAPSTILHPTATYEIPDLPLPRILPCPPAFPKIPFIPCYNVTPAAPRPGPKECRTSLSKMVPPCSGFLTTTNNASKDPSNKCCDGVNLFVSGGDPTVYDPLCLCHVTNGDDANQLLPAPVNHTRALYLVQACTGLSSATFSDACRSYSLRNQIPPMDLPKPPTPAPGNKA